MIMVESIVLRLMADLIESALFEFEWYSGSLQLTHIDQSLHLVRQMAHLYWNLFQLDELSYFASLILFQHISRGDVTVEQIVRYKVAVVAEQLQCDDEQ